MDRDARPTVELAADCDRCAAVCCAVSAFVASADFAIDKPAGVPCPNLDRRRCTIHDALRAKGFPACAAFDCLGAGQRATALYGGPEAADTTGERARAFGTLRVVHEVLWYLDAARRLDLPEAVTREVARLHAAVADAALADAPRLATLDASALRDRANRALRAASDAARARSPGPRVDLRGADRAGRDLRRLDLRGASLRGALLVGADLRGVDLTDADLTGADLRGARLHGANLSGALFLRPSQLAAAEGDATTTLPAGRSRPPHWTPAAG